MARAQPHQEARSVSLNEGTPRSPALIPSSYHKKGPLPNLAMLQSHQTCSAAEARLHCCKLVSKLTFLDKKLK